MSKSKRTSTLSPFAVGYRKTQRAIKQLRAGKGPIYDAWLAGYNNYRARVGLPPFKGQGKK